MVLKTKPNFLTFEEVNVEAGNAPNTIISLNNADVRKIAGSSFLTTNTTISINNLFGKALLFAQQGKFYLGGYWVGTLASSGSATQNYYMIVAPKSGGQISSSWYSTYSVGTPVLGDGLLTTEANPGLPGHAFALNLNLNGYSDWFIPSSAELRTQANNRANLAAATPSEAFNNSVYWSADRSGYYVAYSINFSDGSPFGPDITNSFFFRATRRELIT